MQEIKVIETIETGYNEHDEQEHILTFSGYMNDFKFFEFIPEKEVNDEKVWEELYQACLKKNCQSVDWKPKNGESYILVTEKFVEFCIAKYGDGNGGGLMVRVPVESCLQPFKNVFEKLCLKN
jgi:hypothetical protein